MRLAYADPPYLGYAGFYKHLHPDAMDYDDPETHRRLFVRLADEFADGWAVSCTSGNLRDLLPMTPKGTRVAAWVKPFCSFKPGVNPAYAWEPVLFFGGRKRDKTEATVRDWAPVNITLRRGFTGAKPEAFCWWVFDLLGAQQGDEFHDLFPGSGAVTDAWDTFCRRLA